MTMTPASTSQVPGVVGVEAPSSSAPATPSTTNKGTASVSNILNSITGYLSSGPFLHLAGLVSLSVLTGVGVVPVDTGLPLIVGTIGLGINTAKS